MSLIPNKISFSDIPYTRPDMDILKLKYSELQKDFNQAQSAEQQLDILDSWNELRMQLSTISSYANVRLTQNVKDEWAISEKEFLDKHSPTLSEWNTEFTKAIVDSKFRKEIEKEWGSLFLEKIELGLQTFKPEIKEDMIEESEQTKKYSEILASAQIEFDGEIHNISSLSPLILSPDRETRKRAQQKLYSFIGEKAESLDTIYDSLVQIRTKTAKKLGFTNYTELAYKELGRTEYTRNEVAVFRKQILDVIVPLVHRFKKEQAERLGLTELFFHDENLLFADGNPKAQGDPDWIIERASEMYKELSPETDSFFTMMREQGLMDLVNRPNKSPGGYCTSFAAYGIPFIFSNFNGTTHDIEVLTHEAGHALQSFMSRIHKPMEYRWPSYEACEIHSMSMEYITWPWMENFFGPDTDKFKYYHIVKSLIFLPYACAVDEFQHWIYDNPEATAQQRLENWKSMEQKYLPWRTYDDNPEASQGRVWQLQAHIYKTPFYYIDYALAQICALQFWVKSRENQKEAMKDYLHICEIGGSKTFLEIVKEGNLQSPFKEGTVAEIVKVADTWIKERTPMFIKH